MSVKIKRIWTWCPRCLQQEDHLLEEAGWMCAGCLKINDGARAAGAIRQIAEDNWEEKDYEPSSRKR